jgi:hypothetical protein
MNEQFEYQVILNSIHLNRTMSNLKKNSYKIYFPPLFSTKLSINPSSSFCITTHWRLRSSCKFPTRNSGPLDMISIVRPASCNKVVALLQNPRRFYSFLIIRFLYAKQLKISREPQIVYLESYML